MRSTVALYILRKYFLDFKLIWADLKPNLGSLLVSQDMVDTEENSQTTEFLLN